MKKLDPRSVIIGFLIAVIGFMSLGATDSTFDSITVGDIKLKNSMLKLIDTSGEDILTLEARPNYHGMYFHNSDGMPVSSLTQTDEGNGLFWINNKAGEITVELSGGGSISINGDDGQATIRLGQSVSGSGTIALKNKEGNEVIVLGTINDNGAIEIKNKAGENTISAKHSTVGDGVLMLNNKHGKGIVYITATEEQDGQIALADRYGKIQSGMTGKRK